MTQCFRLPPRLISTSNYSSYNPKALQSFISGLDWTEITYLLDLDVKINTLTKYLQEVRDLYALLWTFQAKRLLAPWLACPSDFLCADVTLLNDFAYTHFLLTLIFFRILRNDMNQKLDKSKNNYLFQRLNFIISTARFRSVSLAEPKTCQLPILLNNFN